MRPASTSTGPSTTTYASTSRVPDMLIDPRLRPVPDIDPRLYPLPNDFDFDLTDPATVAKARGLVPAKKVAGSRRSSKAMSGKGKKRARESSESDDSDDDAPVAKRGRPSGAANYSKEDVQALFGFIEKELPLGQRGWKAVHGHYTKYRRANKRPKRSIKSLENKYKQVRNSLLFLSYSNFTCSVLETQETNRFRCLSDRGQACACARGPYQRACWDPRCQ